MLLKRRFLDGIADGSISLVFRRWRKPTVKAERHLEDSGRCPRNRRGRDRSTGEDHRRERQTCRAIRSLDEFMKAELLQT